MPRKKITVMAAPAAAERPTVRQLGDLFTVFEIPGKPREVQLGGELFQRHVALNRNLKSNDGAAVRFFTALSLTQSFLSDPITAEVPDMAESNFSPGEIAKALIAGKRAAALARVYRGLLESLNDELQNLFLAPEGVDLEGRKKLMRRATLRFKKLAAGHYLKFDAPVPGQRGIATVQLEDGRNVQAPIPWFLIQVAMTLVQKTGELPTKAAVQTEACRRYPEAKQFSERAWNNYWREAGLNSLPRELRVVKRQAGHRVLKGAR